MLAQDDARLHGDGTAERMADDDEAARAATAREIGSRRDIVHAARQVVRFAITDSHCADALRGQLPAEVMVKAFGGSEEASHTAAARHNDVAR